MSTTSQTDAATYPADFLGKTLVVHRDLAAALETELREAEQEDNAANHYLSRAEKAEAECLEQARLLGMSANQNAKLLTEVNKLTTLWQQFISIMNIVEESDNGKEFRPNRIQSCRVLDAQKMSDIIEEAKQLVHAGVNKLH
jgi:hypothetical protein